MKWHSAIHAYDIFNNSHFLDSSFQHVDGSGCCAPRVNSTPSTNLTDCITRCVEPECTAAIFQPGTGLCWVGRENPSGRGLVKIPANDRISAVSHSARISNILLESRFQTGALLSNYQPGGLGVLLGVGTGEFATRILETWDGGLYLVDPYIHILKGYEDQSNFDDKTHQLIYENLRELLHNGFEHKHVMVRDFSWSFAKVWEEKAMPNPTFVYIDITHAAEALIRDISIWWKLLAPGGLIGGSHFVKAGQTCIEVKHVLLKTLGDHHTVYVSESATDELSWFIFKPLN